MSELVNDYKKYSLKPRGAHKNKPYDNSKSRWKEKDIVEQAYKASSSIYKNYSWYGAKYSKEDFNQDAAMYILNKFREGYFKADRENVFPIIYRLINGFFVYNKYKETKNERRVTSLNSPLVPGNSGEVLDNIVSPYSDVEKYSINGDGISLGYNILEKAIDKMNIHQFKTRKHKYTGVSPTGEKIDLTEANIAKLIVSGEDLHSILRIFNCDVSNSGSNSMSAYIAKIVKSTKDKIISIISNMSVDSRNEVIELLEFRSLVEDSNIL